MSNYFTYEKFQDSYVVHFPASTSVKYNYTYKKLVDAVFRVTNQHEACLLTKNNCQTIVSISLYAQLPDDDRYIPHDWRHVIGVIVGTKEQAIELTYELDKMRTWALLQR
jgi:hypothetical protein